uniref:Uncharacterized protein n=1 Tax=Romanomermis culicivorax TaxID=13658 RepID=A0A915K9Y4_ROMCU
MLMFSLFFCSDDELSSTRASFSIETLKKAQFSGKFRQSPTKGRPRKDPISFVDEFPTFIKGWKLKKIFGATRRVN